MPLSFAIILTVFLLICGSWIKAYFKSKINTIYFLPVVLILCVDNCEKYVEGIIRTILGWQRKEGIPEKLVIIEYNSTDKTGEILQRLNYGEARFEFLRQKELYISTEDLANLGLAENIRKVFFYINCQTDLAEQLRLIRRALESSERLVG